MLHKAAIVSAHCKCLKTHAYFCNLKDVLDHGSYHEMIKLSIQLFGLVHLGCVGL